MCPSSDEDHLLIPVKVIAYNNPESSVQKVVKMAQLHDKLTDIITLVNRRFSIQVNTFSIN